MNRICPLLSSILLLCSASAQVSIVTTDESISENFNSLPGSPDNSAFSWTDNSTITGWYLSTSGCRIESSPSGMDNTGAVYTMVSDSDRSLGSKASVATGTLHYGLRLKNMTGQTISSIQVSFYGEQWSIAENEANVNELTFSYQVGSTVTSLATGTWTTVSDLTFLQLYTSAQSAGMGGTACSGFAAQCLSLDGNASANRRLVTACFDVALPAGNEIMLRWTDTDTPSNDHHLQIDDITVEANNVSCSVALPVTWGKFNAVSSDGQNELWWETMTETNASHFEIERQIASTGFKKIGKIPCKGESLQPLSYYFIDQNPAAEEINYYRLKQVDRNGASEYSEVIAVAPVANSELLVRYDPFDRTVRFSRPLKAGTEITCVNLSGEIIFKQTAIEAVTALQAEVTGGMFLIVIAGPDGCRHAVKLPVF